MATIVSSILRAATRQSDEPLNILLMPTHEAYETGLAKTGHRFFAFRVQGFKDWNKEFRPVPRNYTLLDPDKGEQQLPPEVVFDLVLSQNRLGSPSQFQVAASLARSYSLPHINLEHCLPHVQWDKGKILRLKELRADHNVYISDYSRRAWMDETEGLVIEHGIDTDLFCPPSSPLGVAEGHVAEGDTRAEPAAHRKPMLLSVVNDWVNRDWCCGFKFWQEATRGLPCMVVGDTPGLSEPAKTVGDLVAHYQDAAIFVNTSLVSPVPTALLEAMACGCAVISTSTCMIPEIIEYGENGYLCENPEQMSWICRMLLDNPDLCRRMGQRARQTILDRFSMGRFTSDWNEVFDLAVRRGRTCES